MRAISSPNAPDMAKKSQRKRASSSQGLPTSETRTAETATVAWVMLTLTTLLCEIGAVAVVLIRRATELPPGVDLLGRLLFFAACVAGLFGLAMLPPVYRLRIERPPRMIIVVSVVICCSPLVAALWLALSA